jgi:hypothetical protein
MHIIMKNFQVLAILILAITFSACGGGHHVGVTVSPATMALDGGQATTVTATVTHDSSNSGVTFALSCSAASCGTLSATSAKTVPYTTTYTAPTTVASSLQVTITATSVKDTGKKATSVITVSPIGVAVSPATMGLDQGQATTVTATVTHDFTNSGVTFALTCAVAPCGTLSAVTATTVLYTAPATVASSLQATITAKSVQDSSKTAASVITVNPNPTIVTTSLPSGVVGTQYSQTLQAAGGTTAYTWSLASGSAALPLGLTLSSSGTISGKPTVAGTSTFTVKVTDSAGGGAMSATQQMSIVVNAAPLSIVTTSLPNGVVNTSYSQTLQAAGGTSPYVWSLASGSAALPSGLTLSSSGTISGTPTAAGPTTFSVQVTDASTPIQTATQSLSITITTAAAACGSGHESALTGQYAFSLSGYYSAGFQAYIGSFTADGKGNISAGAIDGNGVGTGVQSGTITASTYTIGSDYRGCVTINTTIGNFTTHFALENNGAVATEGALETWEPGGTDYIASGEILKQSVPSALPKGVWVYEQVGSYGGARMGVVGTATSDGAGKFTDGEYDSNPAILGNPHTGVTGIYGTPDPTTGRYAVTTTLSGISVNRTEYLVDGTHFLELTSSGSSVLVGKAQLQSTPLTLSGNLAYYASEPGAVQLGRVSIAGGNTLNVNAYTDDAGTPTSKTKTCTYVNPDSYGRVTMSGASCGNGIPVLYLTSADTAVLLGTDAAVMLGRVEPQPVTSITSGTYYLGTSEVNSQSVNEVQVGEVTVSNNVVTGTSDNTSTTATQQSNQPISTTLSPNTDGSFSDSDHPGQVTGIVVSDGEIVIIDGLSSTYPTLVVVKQAIK